MQLDIQMLLDSFEIPGIFYRENTVRYFNTAAQALFPGLKAGKGLPGDFGAPDSPFCVESHETERGTLYLLRPRRSREEQDDMAELCRELRGCLSGMTAATERLACSLTDGEESQQTLGTLYQGIFRLRRMADHSDLLRQMEDREKTVYREGIFDLAELCRDLGEHCAWLARKSGVEFRTECREEHLLLRGDSSLLKRMLLNLVSNALKAVKDLENPMVGFRLEKQKDRVLLTVWDNGAGMEAGRLAAVFRPQHRREMPKPGEGAGLGLRMVREIAVLHGGLVLAEAQPGGGVRMTVSLPCPAVRRRGMEAPPAWGDDGFHLVLTELADVLRPELYTLDCIEE